MEIRFGTWRPGAVHIIRALAGIALAIDLAGCERREPRACQPPRAHWTKPHNYNGLMPELNHVSLTHDGALYWNGQPISTAKLGEYLRRTHRMEPAPEIFLGAEMGVACRDLEAVRNLMEKALDCHQPYSQCAEGLMPVWREIENPPGTPPS